MIQVYIASKAVHGKRWQTIRDAQKNHPASSVLIISTWIDESGPDETKDFDDLWRRCSQEAADCDYMIVYRQPGEQLKGALVEMGIAYGLGKPIILVGDFDGAGSWPEHLAGLTRCADIEQAFRLIVKETANR